MPHYFYVVWPDGYIIFQSFDVCIIENLPSSKNLPKQVHNFAKYQTKISQRLLKFCQSGESSPNLVTLVTSEGGKQGKSIWVVKLNVWTNRSDIW